MYVRGIAVGVMACGLLLAGGESGAAISDLNRYAITEYEVGDLIYSDRAYTITSMPSSLKGALGIQTANDDKTQTSLSWVTFNTDVQCEVCIAYDSRATALPLWMTGYVDTGQVIGV